MYQPTAVEIVCYLFLFSLGTWKLVEITRLSCNWTIEKIFRLVEGPKKDRAIFLQAEKLCDTLRFINTPHVRENGRHEPKSSSQCLGAARVAISEYEDFKKGFKL